MADLIELAHRLHYAAYSFGFEAGKVGQHVDTTIAGNKAAAALNELLRAIAASPLGSPMEGDAGGGIFKSGLEKAAMTADEAHAAFGHLAPKDGVNPCPGDGCNGCAGCWKVSEVSPENAPGVKGPGDAQR